MRTPTKGGELRVQRIPRASHQHLVAVTTRRPWVSRDPFEEIPLEEIALEGVVRDVDDGGRVLRTSPLEHQGRVVSAAFADL